MEEGGLSRDRARVLAKWSDGCAPILGLTPGSDAGWGNWVELCNLNLVGSKMVSGIHLIHLFNQEWLSIYSVPSTGDTDMKRANKDPADMNLAI